MGNKIVPKDQTINLFVWKQIDKLTTESKLVKFIITRRVDLSNPNLFVATFQIPVVISLLLFIVIYTHKMTENSLVVFVELFNYHVFTNEKKEVAIARPNSTLSGVNKIHVNLLV